MIYIADEKSVQDAAAVQAVSWRYLHLGVVSGEELDRHTGDSAEVFWRSRIKEPGIEVYICCQEGRPVGMMGIDRLGAEILALYVLPEKIGSGAGHELLQFALESFEKGLEVSLTVLNCNERARRFYERHGFQNTGEEIILDGSRGISELIYRIETA